MTLNLSNVISKNLRGKVSYSIREHTNNKNHIVESKYTLVVLIRCPECGANTELAAAYYNVEDTEVRCSGCKARLTVTLKNGEIKKIETKGPGIG